MTDTPQQSGKTHGKNAFLFVIVTILIDTIGFGLIIPVMPSLIETLMGLGPEEAVAWGGALTATYALMNFLAGPTLGSLSDRYGRRVVLLVSIGTLAIDFIIMGMANSIVLLFIGRALSGISSATYSTANAYIADVTTPEERGKAFGMVGAAFGVGFIIGPAIGGLLGEIDPRAPFFAAAGMCTLNFLYGFFVLPESLTEENRRDFKWSRANPMGAMKHFSKLPKIAWFLVAVLIFAFAHAVYPSTWSFHGEIRYDWTPREIGISLAVFGVGSAIVQAGLMGIILKRIGAFNTAMLGLSVNVLAFAGMAMAGFGWIAYALMPLSALGGVASPAINSIMSNQTPKDAQGELQGASASLQSLALIFSPLVMTQALYHFSKSDAPIHFPGAAFALASLLAALAIIPFLMGVRAHREPVPAE
ncbi:MAG: TCR/Tet family MFS transporter [Hyphomonadaceae bacterium]